MQRHFELQRFAQLLEAFVHLAQARDDIQLRGSASPPPLGFAVRLQPGPVSGGVELAFSLEFARIRAWSPSGDGPDERERIMDIDLSRGFRYECLLFPDAEALALTLLQRLEGELDAPRPPQREGAGHA